MAYRTLLASLAVAIVIGGCSPAPAGSPTTPPGQPAAAPTIAPTAVPTKVPQPTAAPTAAPTQAPVALPTANWDEMSFDQITTIGDQTTQGKWAIKKGKIRIEMSVMGQQMTFIGDPDKKVGYAWTEGQNQVMKMPYDQFEQQTGAVPDPQELAKDALQGKVVGTDTVDGQACDVYEIAGTATTLKIWIAKNDSFPVKSEVNSAGGTITTQFKNVKKGNLPDSLFESPTGMQVVDFSTSR